MAYDKYHLNDTVYSQKEMTTQTVLCCMPDVEIGAFKDA